jgi:hypothetical protein
MVKRGKIVPSNTQMHVGLGYMTVLALIGIKVALNIIALRVSLMIDYSVLTDRQINHIKVWTHKTSLALPLCVEVSVPGMQLRVSILPFFVYDCVIGFRNYGKVYSVIVI